MKRLLKHAAWALHPHNPMHRAWIYHSGTWEPSKLNRFLPMIGADEYGRHTIVQRVTPWHYLVVAYKTCNCTDCQEMREETARLEEWVKTNEAKPFIDPPHTMTT